MQKITVASVNIKTGTNDKGGWTNITIIDEDGGRFSSFDTKLSKLTKGAVIEAEIEVKGKFTNIKEWKLISEGTALSPMSKEDWSTKDKATRESIERQVIFKGFVELVAAGKLQLTDFDGFTKTIEPYFNKGANGQTIRTTTMPDKEQTATKAWDDMGSPSTTQLPRVDPDWITESCKKLNWTEPTIKSYLKGVFKVDAEGSISDMVNKLSKEQQDKFVKEIQDRLKKVGKD